MNGATLERLEKLRGEEGEWSHTKKVGRVEGLGRRMEQH